MTGVQTCALPILKLLFYAIPRTCAELYPGLSVAALIAASATASWQLIGSNIAFLPPLIGFLLSILIVEIHSAYKEEIERRE